MTNRTDHTERSSCRESLLSIEEAESLNALQLAYMGDAVWEMIVRTRMMLQRRHLRRMHEECVKMVNAAAQARHMKRISGSLTEKEQTIAHRGRNAHAKHPTPKNQIPADYAEATGFESLLGFLYITGQDERISALSDLIFSENTDYTHVPEGKIEPTGKAYGIRKRDIRRGAVPNGK